MFQQGQMGVASAQNYTAEAFAKQQAMATGGALVSGIATGPPSTVQDILAESYGGLYELRSALGGLADRITGPIPQPTGKDSNLTQGPPPLHELAYAVRSMVAACHEEMARIQRVL